MTALDSGDRPPDADDLQQQLRASLEPYEKILWVGFPQQGIVFTSQDTFMIPFSILWGGFAIFWEVSVFRSHRAPAFFVLWGVPFVLVGLYLIFGRFFADARTRARTIYALTDQRVVILGGFWRPSLRSLELAGLSEINLTERQDGRGSITFGPLSNLGAGMRGWPTGNRNQSPCFEGIPQARSVLTQIRDARRKLAGDPKA